MAEQTQLWLITGAAGALGRSLIQLLIERGDDCIAIDRDAKGLEQLHDGLQSEGLRPPALYPMDLAGASLDDFHTLAEAISEKFGRLDHIVHAAATFAALRPLMHQPAEEWMRISQVGIHAPVFLTQALLPLLPSNPTSTITWIIDDECIQHPAHWGAYGMVQVARHWLAGALAAELGPKGPTVSALSTDSFLSPIRQQAWPAHGDDAYRPVVQVARDLLAIMAGQNR